jgi:TatA/E family protein of Tat protein translocase
MSHPLLALSAPGFPELVFIFMLCLLMFGAKKLPELAKGLGKSLGEFQKAKAEFEREIAKAAHPVEIKDQPDKVAYIPNPVAAVSSPEPSEPKTEILPAKS